MSLLQRIKEQYEKFPYPSISLLAKAKAADCHLINYEAGMAASFGSCKRAVMRPKILIAGCGTFEPYIVALANPNAEITALDFSSRALKKLRWRMRLRCPGRKIKYICSSIEALSENLGKFDMIVATGILHHLENPTYGLKKLASFLEVDGVFRVMLYSKHGRSNIYKIRDLARALSISTGSELRAAINLLPNDHPLRIHFYLYADIRSEAGIRDGFLNVIDAPMDALQCEKFLSDANLEATYFIHSPSGQPSRFDELYAGERTTMRVWEKIAALDRISELESNFIFWARSKGMIMKNMPANNFNTYKVNPALRGIRARTVFSKLLGEKILITPKLKKLLRKEIIKREDLNIKELTRLTQALWLLPLE